MSLFWETFAAVLRIISYLLMTITFLWAGIYLTHGYYTGLPNIHWSFSFIAPLLIVNSFGWVAVLLLDFKMLRP